MTTESADIFVCMDVLSVGKGDLKLTWDPDDPEDEAKAKATIEKMLREGYSIFVETDVGPARVQRFSRERMEYIIAEVADGVELPTGPAEPPALAAGPPPVPADGMAGTGMRKRGRPKGSRNKRTKEKAVPVAGSRATAVGRTAGG